MSLYDVAREVTEETFGRGSYHDPRVRGQHPSLPSSPATTLSQAVSQINMRKANLDHIYEEPKDSEKNRVREHELSRVLEILAQVRI